MQLAVVVVVATVATVLLGLPAHDRPASADRVVPYVYDRAARLGDPAEGGRALHGSGQRRPPDARSADTSGFAYDDAFIVPHAFARSDVNRLAPNTAMPPIRPGASGGPTAERPFGQPVREASIANNLATTGADVPTCVWCRMETRTPHVGHATPRSLGGNATLENAQVSCPHCNMSRGNRPTPVNPPGGYEGPWPPPWWSEL